MSIFSQMCVPKRCSSSLSSTRMHAPPASWHACAWAPRPSSLSKLNRSPACLLTRGCMRLPFSLCKTAMRSVPTPACDRTARNPGAGAGWNNRAQDSNSEKKCRALDWNVFLRRNITYVHLGRVFPITTCWRGRRGPSRDICNRIIHEISLTRKQNGYGKMLTLEK